MSAIDPASLPDEPRPSISPLRVLVALLIVALVAGGAYGIREVTRTDPAMAKVKGGRGPWFAPYVDATLTPTIAFQDPSANPAGNAVLGFVVAGREDDQRCTPTWGAYHTLDEAAVALDLDRRVAQLRGQGRDAIISFGGQANDELAVACSSADELKQAYAETIERYDADTVDFDVEGDALRDTAANTRRAEAVKALQDEIRARDGRLAVWLTLPVTPDGLQDDALAVVRAMLDARVDLAGVNIMAMDFGVESAAKDMRGAILSATKATREQLAAVFAQAGLSLNTRNVWRKVGVTIMIGQNDVAGERVSVEDAETVAQYALDHGLGRAAIWSLNRDQQCGATFAVIGQHSNTCSGVRQKPLAFSRAFAKLRGSVGAAASSVTTRDLLPEVSSDSSTADDPARSPYPIWQPEQAYREGYKVVWHRAVYVAKWFSQGQTPDAQNVPAGQNPWRLIGPVLKTDRAPRIPTLPAGTHPKWSAGAVYTAGNKVLYRGLPYSAQWYTQGDVPGEPGPNGTPSPWKPLYRIPGEPAPTE
ncbi:chitinase [Conexibacter sp. JD483]|uniref:chitinase n=1 Tax=unclassified Conexibacter TaxID=2627773 RepID=UPI00271E2CCE|nr:MULTISPECIES: chitinase [unclassified Conexibacter]MDO8185648.1 chitinase [Conexibacter sp. CPCC 205706]MDO8198821.1 chitinase [Conexibacter sp. CPCC 205762]MDR9367829.1 chitinase [Conexibacter sp. JD483]